MGKQARQRGQTRRRHERGSVITEFLIVFPAFLVLAMFVVEVGLMWADRHVVRLAAFEAARVYAGGTMPEFKDGAPISDPCEAPALSKRARQAAVLKIAVISPPLPLFLAKLGVDASQINFGEVPSLGAAGDRLLRLVKRWPTAVASTAVTCTFDPDLKQVHVGVTYQRMLQTPIVDRVMFVLYELAHLGDDKAVQLDANMFGLTTDSTAAIDGLRQILKTALGTVERTSMSVEDALPFLKGVPGLGPLFDQLPSVPAEIGQVAAKLDEQSGVLTSLVAAVPEALRRIPVHVEATLQRDPFTARVDSSGALAEKAYDGSIRGVLPLDRGSGDYRKFLKDLSGAGHAQDGDWSTGAQAVEAIP